MKTQRYPRPKPTGPKPSSLKPQSSLLICAILIATMSGCTCMIGTNTVGQLAPRGSYRSVDTSGQESEGLQEMQGGGTPTTTVSTIP